jgi:hypothetical protein
VLTGNLTMKKCETTRLKIERATRNDRGGNSDSGRAASRRRSSIIMIFSRQDIHEVGATTVQVFWQRFGKALGRTDTLKRTFGSTELSDASRRAADPEPVSERVQEPSEN